MKKVLVFTVALFLFVSKGYSAGLYDIDWESKVWRSSVPATETANMLVTTGTIAIYGVCASSPITSSSFIIYNTSSTDSAVDVSAFTYMSPATNDPKLIPIKKVFNKGIRWTTKGSGVYELLWDYISKPPLVSNDSKGRY